MDRNSPPTRPKRPLESASELAGFTDLLAREATGPRPQRPGPLWPGRRNLLNRRSKRD